MHVDADESVPLTGLAAPSRDIEAEPAGLVSARPRGGKAREKIPDRTEYPDVGGGVGTRAASDRGLIDDDGFVEVFESLERVVIARFFFVLIEMTEKGPAHDVVDEGGLSAAGEPGHANETSEG